MSEILSAHQALLAWAEKMPERVFMVQPVDGRRRNFTWRESADSARCMASALFGLGLKSGDKVGILAKNCAEWILADVAIAMAGMISVPIYTTASSDTIRYIIAHSEVSAIFVGKLDNPALATQAIPPALPKIAFPYPTQSCQHQWTTLVEENEPLGNLHQPDPGEPMTILYTSGSTGTPKGVVISYGAYCYASQSARNIVDLQPEERLISYLPLAHIVERTVIAGPAIYAGAQCSFVESLQTFQEDLKRAAPTLFVSMPRLWVRFQAAVHEKIPPRMLNLLLSLPMIRGLIARRIRAALGFSNVRIFGSGSAPISPLTLRWYQSLGVHIGEGWGMSETSGLSCCNIPFQAERIGTIGVPVPGTEIKLSPAGEILIRSPGLFSDYYKDPQLTKEVFTPDGFFHTGDKAEWDEDLQAYRITGRIKDLFKTSKGKYVAPVPIEARLAGNPLLEQVCVMGSGLPAPVVVVVLGEAARKLPRGDVEASFMATLSDVDSCLEAHERLSHIIIVNDEWTTENGLLTPTFKIKRDVLEAKYQQLIGKPSTCQVAWESELRTDLQLDISKRRQKPKETGG